MNLDSSDEVDRAADEFLTVVHEAARLAFKKDGLIVILNTKKVQKQKNGLMTTFINCAIEKQHMLKCILKTHLYMAISIKFNANVQQDNTNKIHAI